MKKELFALIVDDGEINLFVVREVLKSVSIGSDMAVSGAKAIEMCRQNQYDLIFMDHLMPEMDGIEAAKHIRGITDAPIIAMTANDDSSAPSLFMENGFAGYLQKPMDVEPLTALLKTLMPEWLPCFSAAAEVEDTALTEIVAELGLDMNTAISKIGGNAAEYKTILRIMALISPGKLSKLQSFVKEEKWEDFRIAIHAQKGALANVGATALAAEARAMEELAKNGETAKIPEAFSAFRESMTQFCELLNALWPLEGEPNGEVTEADIRKLPAFLRQIGEHMENLEHDQALEVLEPLLSLRFEESTVSALKSIRASIGAFDYDAAAQEVNHLLEEVNPK